MIRRLIFVALGLFLLTSPAFGQGESTADAKTTETDATESLLGGLEWRLVGPFRGGRSAAATGVVGQRDVYYFGATGGGVWKTTDAGESWQNVSDGFFGGSIGAVAVSEWDPNVIYVGGGEKTVRGNVSHGDGVWKSVDAGKTWSHVGLSDSRHVPRLRIHPRNPDLAYACALGHLFGPNEERGVFRTTDGGETWERVHFVSPEAGCVELAMDPTNPRVLYAGFWRVLRTPWSLESGGEGSGLWKSTDGGETWSELTRQPGLPEGTVGIWGIAVSPSNAQNLYAIVEAEEGGVFRSKDGGETWERTNEERKLRQRAWYYTRIYADPADEETVYVLNVRFHRSKDGGRTFEAIPTPHGDNHDLWIDPEDPRRMIEANDGGANVSDDGGGTWSAQNNQPTAQFYRVTTDDVFPYRIYGAQQDNSTVRIRHRTGGRGIGERDWEPTAGGESGHLAPDPENADVVYGGSYGGYLTRLDHATGQNRLVDVWPDNPMGWGTAELRYRFQWNFPIFFSPHDPDVLYTAANVLFRTEDEGQSWRAISPDLTRDDKSKQGPSGGPITKDNTGVEYYATIFAALESPHEPGVHWAGSDDGLLHLSRNGGESWENVTPPGLPEWAQINSLEPHPTEPGGLYLAATRYKLDDFSPYLYATADYGATWRRIDGAGSKNGIDRGHFTRVVRADPGRAGLLYAGTERGVWVSFDDGASWRPLQLDLPEVPITDLAVHEGDLVAATQGRSFWVLDDLTVLHQLESELAGKSFHLFEPRAAYRFFSRGGETPPGLGENPPDGVVVHYHLTGDHEAEDAVPVTLELLDAEGEVLRRFTSHPEEAEKDDEDESDEPRLEASAGAHRFAWDFRLEDAETFPGLILWSRSGLEGPAVPPGSYKVRLSVGEESQEAGFEVLPDPRLDTPQKDYEAQYAFLVGLRDKLSEIHRSIGEIRELRGQLEALGERLGESEAEMAFGEDLEAVGERLTAIEEALYQTQNRSRQDPLNFPIRLNDKLASLARAAGNSQHRPTEAMAAVGAELTAAIDAELERLRQIGEDELPELNRRALELEVPALTTD